MHIHINESGHHTIKSLKTNNIETKHRIITINN